MYRKLNLDRDKIDRCRGIANRITAPVQKYIDRHSTTTIERSVLRVFGIEGALDGMPLVNLIVDSMPRTQLRRGIAWCFGKALVHTNKPPDAVAREIVTGKIKFDKLPNVPRDKVKAVLDKLTKEGLSRIDAKKRERDEMLIKIGSPHQPLKYLIVATGNIHDDCAQATSAAQSGADVIAVIRHTAQSLLDYVPDGITTEGFGGTYATQANFKLMREKLDGAAKEMKRYVRLVNYSSGMCMPEIAVMGAVERLDMLLNDSMYGILFRDINMKRTFIDQYFSRLICARAGIMINTGEDNYLTTTDSYRNAHQVLASQFINESFALKANLPSELMGLGHAFEIDPAIEDSFLYEFAQAQMIREIFPRAPIKYMPPTKFMSGDIFFGNVLDAMFNVAAIFTEQSIQLLGIPTEAIHNPHIQDRFWSLKNANYVFNAMRHISDELGIIPGGKIARRAHTVLENAHKYLAKVESTGLMKAITRGQFADIERAEDGGKGLEGVFQKDREYMNPVLEALKGG